MVRLVDGAWTVTLGGQGLTVIANPDQIDQDDAPGYSGSYFAQDSSETTTKRDVVVTLQRFNRGCGVIVRNDANDDGCIGWAENGISWMGQGLYPSGRRFASQVNNSALGQGSGTAIIDSRPFVDGHRYCITNGGWVIRVKNDDPRGTTASGDVAFSPALNSFADATHSLHAGYVCTAIEVFKTSTGVPCLLVFAYSSAVPATKVYKYTVAGGWTNTDESAVAATWTNFKVGKAVAPVWWESSSTGAGAQRILVSTVSLSGGAPSTTGFVENSIRNCPEGSDPMKESNYVAPIPTDPGANITRLLAFPQFAFAVTKNGLWTFNEIRSMNVTPFATVGSSYGTAGNAALYSAGQDYAGVVIGRGFGANFYDARAPFSRQGSVTEIGPTAYFQDGIPIRGQWSCPPVQHEQWLIQALYDHASQTAYVGRGAPRSVLNVDGPGPWAQYWAEHVQRKSASTGQQITHMVVSSPTVATGTVVPARELFLWLCTADEPTSGAANFAMQYAPLPLGGGPFSFQASTSPPGSFSFAATSTFYLTSQDYDDLTATKFLRRVDAFGALQSQSMAVYARTDNTPTTITDISTWTQIGGTLVSDYNRLTPGSDVSGNQIGLQAILTTNTATVGPALKSISLRSKVVRETFQVRYLWVVLEKDHALPIGTTDLRDVDTVFAAVVALQDLGRQTFVDEQNVTHQVLVEQGIQFRRVEIEENVWRTVMRLELSLVT